MRFQGKISKWLDDKGYGFVVVNGQDDTIFAHISAFPKGQNRPQVGELVTFEVAKDVGKGPKAFNVEYVQRPLPQIKPGKNSRWSWTNAVVVLLVILILGYLASNKLQGPSSNILKNASDIDVASGGSPKSIPGNGVESPLPAAPIQLQSQSTGASFQCAGKTHCSDRVSCDEA
ncbi:MAG: cold shock domain-containing protein, partial [Pseudomonadota bacterium]